jgi:hypothetical protein
MNQYEEGTISQPEGSPKNFIAGREYSQERLRTMHELLAIA